MTDPTEPLSRRRFLQGSGALIASGLVAAACGSSKKSSAAGATTTSAAGTATTSGTSAWDGVVQAANAEGKLEVWSVLNPTHNASVAAAFKAAYPKINVTMAQYTPSDLITRVDAEQAAKIGSQDVLLNTDRIWHKKHIPDGYFNKITGPDVLAADKLVRNGAALRADDAPVATQALYDDDTLLITLFGPWGYAWNKDAVKSAPTFEALFADDTYKGRIGMNDPGATPINAVLDGKLNERYPGLSGRLGKLHPTLYPLSGAAAQALAAGAVDVVLAINQGAVTQPNLGFAFDTKFPALATTVYGELMASSKSPNAAQLFVNWLMTPPGQEAWCAGYASVLPNISSASLSASKVEVFETIDPAQNAKYLHDINAALGR